ncbi:hypothetical protein D3Y55_01025 [Mesorhizobium sp. DCY119]|nr:hypothetical protein D3Y55_01025 [Mesorhizobium sp. DCY119]
MRAVSWVGIKIFEIMRRFFSRREGGLKDFKGLAGSKAQARCWKSQMRGIFIPAPASFGLLPDLFFLLLRQRLYLRRQRLDRRLHLGRRCRAG